MVASGARRTMRLVILIANLRGIGESTLHLTLVKLEHMVLLLAGPQRKRMNTRKKER